jgi:hypothetical protein
LAQVASTIVGAAPVPGGVSSEQTTAVELQIKYTAQVHATFFITMLQEYM